MARKNQPKHAQSWQIAIYIRLSKEDAAADESLSVVNQKKILTEYVEQYFHDGFVIVDYFVDDGLTGTDHDRPAFQRMLRAIEDKRVNCVLCKTLSRAFRNYADQGLYLESYFPKHQIRFISVGSPHVDSHENPDSISGFEVPITGLMNDRFAAKTSEDVRRTFDMKRRRGEFIGSFAPYGYQKNPQDKSKFLIDEAAAERVREIFSWFVRDGLSLMGMARRLNEMGIPNPTAYKQSLGLNYHNPKARLNDGLWSPSTLRSILSNPMYLGHMVQGRQKIISYKVHDQVKVPEDQWYIKENTHAPLVDPLLFDQAQDLLQRDTRTANGSKTLSLFAGFVRCGDCGKALHRRKSKGLVYYVCRTHHEKLKSQCAPHTIRLDVLEAVVTEALRAQILLAEELMELLEKTHQTPVRSTRGDRLAALIREKRTQQEKLQKAVTSLYLDLKSGLLSEEEYHYMKKSLDAQLGPTQEALRALEGEMHDQENSQEAVPMLEYFVAHKTFQALDRGLLAALVEGIRVYQNKEVEIVLKYRDQYERLMECIWGHSGATGG